MSEYWVSKKKYFCKYCEIYIADDVPSRQHHENGLRHKGNRERFIRGLYKEGEKRKKDLDEEKREMARVESAARAAYAQDISTGLAKASSSSAEPSSSRKPSVRAPTRPPNVFENYSTAASLGYTDPDAERAAAEATRRQTQGIAGDWQVVEVAPDLNSISTGEDPAPSLLEETFKRPAEDHPDDTRSFKLQKKTLATGLGEIYDPGVIKLKPKKQKTEEEVKSEETVSGNPFSGSSSVVGGSEKPKWSTVKWKRAGEAPSKEESQIKLIATAEAIAPDIYESGGPGVEVSPLTDATDAQSETLSAAEIPLKTEPEETKPSLSESIVVEPASSMFRKRKVMTGSGSRIKREI
ncbi:hypothetical protein GYMLUDRAFT_257069 [Collybiopsis luxurians FD-317 M1]|nr:hypothetical protein GYMLUDRAFT_257069 [Collybiopsis luxurians FD-317 M1]